MDAIGKRRLGELLLEAGVIDATQLQSALGHQRQWGVRLGQALVDLKLAGEADIVQALSRKYGYEVARLDALDAYALEQALRLVPREFALRNNVFPLAADPGALTVAMSDPTNLAVVDELRFRTGRRVKVCIGGDREIAAAVKERYPHDHAIEAIALDLDADETPGEAVLDPFGGGSKDALEAFFGSGPAPASPASARLGREPVPPAPTARAHGSGALPSPWLQPTTGVRAAVAPGAALGTGAGRAEAPGPRADARSPGTLHDHLELEDAHPDNPEAVGLARAAFLGDVPPGGLADPEEHGHGPAAQPAPFQPPAPPPAEPLFQAVPEPSQQPDQDPHGGGAQFTERERAVLAALDRLAGGAHAEPELLRPAQAMAAVIRLLIRRGIVSEREFLDELERG